MTNSRTASLLLAAALSGALAGAAAAHPNIGDAGVARMDDGKVAPAPAPTAPKETDKKDADKPKATDGKKDVEKPKDKAACGGPNGCGGKK